MKIEKNSNFLKINLIKSEDLNLTNKAFIFDNKTSLDVILKKMETEYDFSFSLSAELKEKIEGTLNKHKSFTTADNDYTHQIEEILEITKKLNINQANAKEFLNNIFSKSESDLKNEKHLKILYFNISQEISRLTKIKNRADEIITRRVTILLLVLLSLLIFQTGWFYHMIFNVDHLGWDLVEPATFLVGSVLFLIGVFSYVKLHKNVISGERLFQDLRKGFLLRRYARDNFNLSKYEDLKVQLDNIEKLIKNYQKI